MYDIDPPSSVLHLSSPQAGRQPTLQSDQQHLAYRGQVELWQPARPGDVVTFVVGAAKAQTTKPRAHIAEGIADHWARLHTARQIETNRAINRGLLTLTEQIDAL